ncbi:MAG TPA: DEAD/DEAH box helicase [Egibacteraceae bacterium]|nr:DEAD/DEAH box helicase [Egibacteraceae bacterium]
MRRRATALGTPELEPAAFSADGRATGTVPAPAYDQLLATLAAGRPVDEEVSRLVDEAAALWARPGFETFMSLPRLRFEPFDYQLRAAERVLRQMRGRAILADEVGLGKTIEAGLVLSELRLRGLAGRSLVVVPAGLVTQWREELERKFALPSVLATGADWRAAESVGEQAVVVASLAAARRAPLRDALVTTHWDLVVVDEAHRVRRARSASGRLARLLRSRYLLLLTATPVENRLADLYELVSLVRPGHLGTPQQFRQRHGQGARSRGPGGSGPAPKGSTQTVRELPALRVRSREVMVRHRRSEVALMLPCRLAQTLKVAPAGDEAALYAAVSERVRADGRAASSSLTLQLRAVQRLAGSSPRALAPTLERVGWRDLAARARQVTGSAKARALVSLLRRHRDRGDKVLVFSGFRETLAFLGETLTDAGIATVVYHGSLGRRDKDAVVAAFRDDAPVLLATEAAGEGRNLQFCHTMVNFDLPWNPMQIEQRLGRLHRIGQDHEVLLTNLVTTGTIEQRILDVLEAKVNLFELVVGELDMILGRVDEEFDFERAVFDAHVSSADDGELAGRLDALGDELARARTAYLDSRARVDALAGEETEE